MKHPLKSKGFTGILAAFMGMVVTVFELDISPGQIDEFIAVLMAFAGLAQGMYGRWVADTPLSFFKPKPDFSKLTESERNLYFKLQGKAEGKQS